MKKNLLFLSAAMLCALGANAQTGNEMDMPTLRVTEGWNADVIVENTPANQYLVGGVDNGSVGFYTHTLRNNPIFKGLPADGTLTAKSGRVYSIDYAKNNALRLTARKVKEGETEVNTTTGTLVFAKPVKAEKLYLLDICGNGPCHLIGKIHYTDGTDEDIQEFEVLDWWGKQNDPKFAAGYFDRILRSSNSLQGGNVNLLEDAISVDATKEVESLSFEMTDPNDTRVCSILGVHDGTNQIEIAEGMLDDVVAEDVPVKDFTTAGLDYDGYVMAANGVKAGDEEPKEYNLGIPNDGNITTVADKNGEFGGIAFHISDFDKLNATRLLPESALKEGETNTVTLKLAGAPVINTLYVLGTAGNGPAPIDITYNMADGSTIESEPISLPDWFGDTRNFTSGRYNVNNIEAFGNCGLYVRADQIELDAPVESITFTNNAAKGESKGIIMALAMEGRFTQADGISTIGSDLKADNALYNVAGQRVGKNYKGLVIKNGKKFLKK